MIVTLFDYGVGNLHSLAKALESWGARVRIEADPASALDADALVLPGVGAFGAAAVQLAAAGPRLAAALADGFPCLGICLGMQLLFDSSEEGPGQGLGTISGQVCRLQAARVPHMGWNSVEPATDPPDPLLTNVNGMVGYFANSYVCHPVRAADVIAWTEYDGTRFPSAVRRGRTWGVQFHPEKSGAPGLQLLRNFLDQVPR
jgi:glutamine amidotransferase